MDKNEIALQLTSKILEKNSDQLFDKTFDIRDGQEQARAQAEITSIIFNIFKEQLNS